MPYAINGRHSYLNCPSVHKVVPLRLSFIVWSITSSWQDLLTISCVYSAAMEEHRSTCEKEGRYVEAEMAKNRIAELKEQEFTRAQEELIFMHEQQRQECEQAHIKQYQDFNEHWDNELQQAQTDDQNEILAVEERHT